MRDYYHVLGIGPEATQEEIKRAFREKALECHPDRVSEEEKEDAEEEFLRIREAFEVLSDPQKKYEYDTNGKDEPFGRSRSRRGSNKEERNRRRSYKEEWRNYRNKKVYVSRDIIESVSGLSRDYDLVRAKTSITIPVCSLLAGLVFLYDPLTIAGTGVFLLDLLLCGLVGSSLGFAIGSVWGCLDLFLKDLGYKE